MSVSSNQIIRKHGSTDRYIPVPVASGETIYYGSLCVINSSGYLANLDSDNVGGNRMVVIPMDSLDNSGGSNGSVNPDGTSSNYVRAYTHGLFHLTASSLSQSDVGKTAYASDNYTVVGPQNGSATKVGTIAEYIDSSTCVVDLNAFVENDDQIVVRGALTGASTTSGGDLFAVPSPFGSAGVVEDLYIDVTAAADASQTVDAGVAADGSTSSDSLIDGGSLSSTGLLSATNDGGSNGSSVVRIASGEYVTGTPSADVSDNLAGTYLVKFRIL